MKVSSKIISGFLVLMLLAIVVVSNQISVIHQMQAVNRDLSEINIKSATIVLGMQRNADLLGDDSKKYFSGLDPLYERQTADLRNDFLEGLARLRQTARSDHEKVELAKLQEALDDFWAVFNQLKQQNKTWDLVEMPPDLTVAVNHLDAQSEVMLDAVTVAIKERVAS